MKTSVRKNKNVIVAVTPQAFFGAELYMLFTQKFKTKIGPGFMVGMKKSTDAPDPVLPVP